MNPAPAPFIVYGLPRSRTFWLSRFLSHGGWDCTHEKAPTLRALEDIRSALDTPYTGTVETAASPWWRLVHSMRPDIRTVVVRRPVEDSIRSLLAIEGCTFDVDRLRRDLQHMDAKLDQIEKRVPGVLSVSFDDLGTEEGCAKVYEHCLGLPHDRAHWRSMAWTNMTINFPAMVRYFEANGAQIARLQRTVTQRVLADLTRSRRVVSSSMTIQQEPFETFLRDGRTLIAQHHVRVGLPPDEVGRMNLPLMQGLSDRGNLLVTTARSNGAIVGYLLTVVAESFDLQGTMEAHMTAFYGDPRAPGVGLKLQRSAIAAAAARGARAVHFRANTRASGPRLGSIYRRLGAVPAGDHFTLDIGY